MATTQTGTCCECGADVSRAVPDGRFSRFIARAPFVCETCVARLEAEREAEERREEAGRADARRAKRLWRAALPTQLADIDLDRLDRAGCAAAIDAAKRWAGTDGRNGLLLTGPFGVGKTTIAAGALRLLLADRPGRWVSGPLLMARLGSGFGTPAHDSALETLIGGDDLVLDDIDKTRPTAYGAEQIFLAVDSAVTNGRRLLVTTNLSGGELAARYPEPFGEALTSRLAGYCEVVRVDGRDRRLDKREVQPEGARP